MSEVQYPFIDVAVHERVSEAFAAGMAVIVFSSDLRSVCWASGRGAALFGFSSVYDFLDQGLDRAELMFRQVEPVARTLKAIGDRRTFTVRIVSGFSRIAVQAHCEMIRFQDRACILLSVPVGSQNLKLSERAERLIEGLSDPETQMAVLDAEGVVLASSAQFAALDISAQTTRMLVSMVGNDRHRLVKRPISTANGYLPAAVGKISGDPALHLIFVVGSAKTQIPTIAQVDDGDTDGSDTGVSMPVGEADYEEALTAVAAIEETFDDEDVFSIDTATEAGEEIALAHETVETMPVAETAAPVTEIEIPAAANMPLVESDNADEAVDGDGTPEISSPSTTAGLSHADDIETEVEASGPSDMPSSALAPSGADVPPETEHTDGTPPQDGHDPVSVPPEDHGNSASDFPAPAAPRGPRTVRFVWKIDAGGRFSEVSREFAEAVGSHAADISGMAFSDLAALFNLDPDGKITELLGKRDTWSGKTIWWPVEGTSLVVPVDLAALPTYTRTREFDGFRGFGIVRMGDAQEDPHAAGLSLVPGRDEIAADPSMADRPDGVGGEDAAGNAFILPVDTPDAEQPSEEGVDENALSLSSHGEAGDEPNEGQDADDGRTLPQDEWPAGERPALKLVANPGQRHSDKVIRLEERRSRLSPGEQAAFQEIARRLDTFAKKAEENDIPATPSSEEDSGSASRDTLPTPAASDMNTAETTKQEREPSDHEQPDEFLAAGEIEDEIELPSPAAEDEPPSIEGDEISADIAAANDDDRELADSAGDPSPAAHTEIHVPGGRDRNGLTADIVDQMPVALLVHAGDDLIHANGEFLRLTGYASLEALADVGGLDALLQRQDLDDKTSEAGGMVVVRADDTIVPVTARLQSIRWNDTAALMLVLMPVALQEQMPSQDAAVEVIPLRPIRDADQLARLQVEVEELRAILETATDGVVIIDAEGDIRSMNRSASALFNFDSDEIDGKPFVTLFAHESQRAIIDYLGGLSGHGVASVLNDGREVIGREASGGFIPLFMTIGRLTSSNGYCAVIRDITQWKRTEEELRTAKRAAETANAHKSEFLAHVSHEIRTPLNAIIGFADMMASERLGPVGHSRYVEYANDIGRSGRHVLDIVNDLLDISKIEAGELDMDFVAVGLNETVSEAVSLVQPQANSQRVIIRTALSQAVPQVVADLRSIKQIVLNILSNAIRFTPSGGQIVVSTAYETNGSVVLRIRDTGIGMSRAELELAMKPFRQVAGAARNRGDGTGLGLPLTKAMVDANRANFAITSAPNEGTLVEVIFPSQRVLAS